MRPWLVLMQAFNVQPRVLADDVMLCATGEWHLENYTQGFTATLQYIEDIGARTAPEKSFSFSTQEGARRWLKTFVWPIIKQRVNVVHHIRDLGAHLNTTMRNAATTSTTRITEAIAIIKRVRFLPHTYDVKAKIIRVKAFTKGLYGCEAVHVNETAIRGMQTATVEAIAPVSRLRSNAMTFSLCSRGDDIDPFIEIFARRFTMMRRMEAKWEWVGETIKRIHGNYAKAGLNGTNTDDHNLRQLKPAPPPAEGDKSAWKPNVMPKGPIGHIIVAVNEMAAASDEDMIIHQADEVLILTLQVPWQQLRPLTEELGIRARNKVAAATRTVLEGRTSLTSRCFNR